MSVSRGAAEPLRLGLLGAARISEDAVVAPARELGVRLVAVAARQRERAAAFAAEHGVERVVADYLAVIEDPEVEAVYNPLANSLHAPWNLAAVAAGKAVLSEKPFAGNAERAREVRDAAARAGVPVIEAFHHLYHPITPRLLALAGNGAIGDLQYVEARMLMPPPAADDPRWSAELDGGGLMDVGCYALHAVRDLAPLCGGEPQVVRAVGGEDPDHPGVDAWMSVELELPDGVVARVESGMTHHDVDFSLRLVGSRGEVFAPNFVKPQHDDRLIRTVGGDQTVEHLGRRTSYSYMLDAFVRLVRDGVPMRSDADDAVTTMQLVDDVYRAAGMQPRGRTASAAPSSTDGAAEGAS